MTQQPTPPPATDTTLRDRIRRAICAASGRAWLPDELQEPDEWGEHADAVLAELAVEPQQAAATRPGATTKTRRTYRLEHRLPDETIWQRGAPGSYAHWSWEDPAKADQRLAEARAKWPEYEHQLIETVTTITETPVTAAPEEPTP
ncbi:hypothetical protein [Streptomyces sp. NPDC047097]|uniref:hypothetical protein n=1 Tax=Streptomyces sp. NPDC047097 TaxID=3155260 RepID=UPI003402BED1